MPSAPRRERSRRAGACPCERGPAPEPQGLSGAARRTRTPSLAGFAVRCARGCRERPPSFRARIKRLMPRSFFALDPGWGRRQGRGGRPAALAATEPAIRPTDSGSVVSLQLRTIVPAILTSIRNDRSRREKDASGCRNLKQRPTLPTGEGSSQARGLYCLRGDPEPKPSMRLADPAAGMVSRTNGRAKDPTSGRDPWREGSRSEPEVAQAGVVVGAAPEGPVELALRLLDGEVVDAGIAQSHQAVVIELPVFVSVGADPVA